MILCLLPFPDFPRPIMMTTRFLYIAYDDISGLDLTGRSENQAAKWLEQPLHIMYLLLGLDFISSHLGGKTRAFCFGGKSHFLFCFG
jgi:hypothetical protein